MHARQKSNRVPINKVHHTDNTPVGGEGEKSENIFREVIYLEYSLKSHYKDCSSEQMKMACLSSYQSMQTDFFLMSINPTISYFDPLEICTSLTAMNRAKRNRPTTWGSSPFLELCLQKQRHEEECDASGGKPSD